MTTFEVVEAKPWHAGQMARALRKGHAAAISKASPNIHRDLATAAGGSIFCRAWMVDGKLAALGGVIGPISGRSGHVWLALSDEAMRHPIAVVREAKRQLSEIMETRRELKTFVVEGDERAGVFAYFLGFRDLVEGPTVINGVRFFPLVYEGGVT